MNNKKLYRSRSNRMICGVCGGLGTFLGVDATVVRVLYAVISLLAGAGFCVGVCQIYGIGVMISCSGMFLYYYRMAIKEFGGTTGDLAGYYVCMAEMSSLLMITVLILLRV